MDNFYYSIEKNITNMYDGQPLRITGHVKVFSDITKTKWLTDIPFSELGVNLSFNECPHTSKEEFEKFIEDKALEAIKRQDIQKKLEEVKMAYDLGIVS